jgi:hypothetical protein
MHRLTMFSLVTFLATGFLFATPARLQEVQPGERCPQECDVPQCTTDCKMAVDGKTRCVTTCICVRDHACERKKGGY